MPQIILTVSRSIKITLHGFYVKITPFLSFAWFEDFGHMVWTYLLDSRSRRRTPKPLYMSVKTLNDDMHMHHAVRLRDINVNDVDM